MNEGNDRQAKGLPAEKEIADFLAQLGFSTEEERIRFLEGTLTSVVETKEEEPFVIVTSNHS